MTPRTYIEEGGTVADKYRIDSLLGSGGFALVYLAERLDLNQTVALKILGDREAPDSIAQRFMREAKVLAKLRDPHTVSILDFGQDHGRLFLVFEYIDGQTLDKACPGVVEPARVLKIICQILESLSEAHALGIIHRDLKPDNVMLFDRPARKDCLKVVDFGIAKAVEEDLVFDAGITADNSVIGTPRYMAPEQMIAGELSPSTDLYSLALVAWQLLHGRRPFEGLSFQQMRSIKLSKSPPVPLDNVRLPFLREFLQRCVHLDPKNRFQNATDALAFLRDQSDEIKANWDPVFFPVGTDPSGVISDLSINTVELALGGTTPNLEQTPPVLTPDLAEPEEKPERTIWPIILFLCVVVTTSLWIWRTSTAVDVEAPTEPKVVQPAIEPAVVTRDETPSPKTPTEIPPKVGSTFADAKARIHLAHELALSFALSAKIAPPIEPTVKRPTKPKQKVRPKKTDRRRPKPTPKSVDFKVKGVE